MRFRMRERHPSRPFPRHGGSPIRMCPFVFFAKSKRRFQAGFRKVPNFANEAGRRFFERGRSSMRSSTVRRIAEILFENFAESGKTAQNRTARKSHFSLKRRRKRLRQIAVKAREKGRKRRCRRARSFPNPADAVADRRHANAAAYFCAARFPTISAQNSKIAELSTKDIDNYPAD